MKHKEITTTHVVFETLIARDDFMTNEMLAAATGHTKDRINSALWVLNNYYHAVECVQQQGKLWWIATPDKDTRTKTVTERQPESRPRRLKVRPPRKELKP